MSFCRGYRVFSLTITGIVLHDTYHLGRIELLTLLSKSQREQS
jgi:hypothetical protein